MQGALAALRGRGVAVEAVSNVYETAPRELEDQPAFLNAACRVATELEPPALLALVKSIERDLGRTAGPRYGPRAIDLDILLWEGGDWKDDVLEVPHPRLRERRFALVPLLDVEPDRALGLAEALAQIDPDEQPVARSENVLALP